MHGESILHRANTSPVDRLSYSLRHLQENSGRSQKPRVCFSVVVFKIPPAFQRKFKYSLSWRFLKFYGTKLGFRFSNFVNGALYIKCYNSQNHFCGSHWIKLITWYKIGRSLSDDIRRTIWYPLSGFISMEGKPTKKRTLKLNFKLVKENQKGLFAKASDG